MRELTPWLVIAIVVAAPVPVLAEDALPRVQITDPFIEMRTGFGDAYPVFHVVERGAWVRIVKRHTDWFKIRTERGVEGWAHRLQLERTLTEAGVGTSFRDVLLDDFLARRLEFGMAAGVAEDDPAMAVHVGYLLHENFTVELGVSRISGTFSSTTLWRLNLLSQPIPGGTFVPYFTLGVGRFENQPRGTLVNAETSNATAINAGLGLRSYLTRRFLVRADFRDYVVLLSDDRSSEVQEYVIGLAFFF